MSKQIINGNMTVQYITTTYIHNRWLNRVKGRKFKSDGIISEATLNVNPFKLWL